MSDFRAIVESEKGTNNRTTISNWAGQLYSFVKEISINDLSLIPSMGSRTYVLVRIVGDYSYEAQDEDGLYHSRRITVLCKDIPRQIFPQSTIYSLGAYRTIFKVRDEKIILSAISKWIKEVKA